MAVGKRLILREKNGYLPAIDMDQMSNSRLLNQFFMHPIGCLGEVNPCCSGTSQSPPKDEINFRLDGGDTIPHAL